MAIAIAAAADVLLLLARFEGTLLGADQINGVASDAPASAAEASFSFVAAFAVQFAAA